MRAHGRRNYQSMSYHSNFPSHGPVWLDRASSYAFRPYGVRHVGRRYDTALRGCPYTGRPPLQSNRVLYSFATKNRGFLPRRGYNRKRELTKSKSVFNPNDPLNLQDLMKETERRRVEGLSPLRGDSRLNTPALSAASEVGEGSPQIPVEPQQNVLLPLNKPYARHRSENFCNTRRSRHFGRFLNRRQNRRQIPITGNYSDYYVRRSVTDRLSYLMSEWFTNGDIADYGCHNGTLTFSILEKFPDLNRIDGIDCDAELIANAKSMQRERIRWNTGSPVNYEKISFQVANWIEDATPSDDVEYDTILAFSVTKWIHLNYGDAGLMRFFRRAFNMLKPGGHLILEPQPKSSYKRTRFTLTQRNNYQTLKIDPSKLEPLLVDLGFSYFDTIKIPKPNEPFRRKIILCTKSCGATPASIRNQSRSQFQAWYNPSPVRSSGVEPPPVRYSPQNPIWTLGGRNSDSPTSESRQIPVTTYANNSSATFTVIHHNLLSEEVCEPDSTCTP